MARLRERLREWIGRPDAATEDESDRDGFLSYAAEWHAVAVGAVFALLTAIVGNPAPAIFFGGILTGRIPTGVNHLRDAAKETAYSGGAFVVVWSVARFAGTL